MSTSTHHIVMPRKSSRPRRSRDRLSPDKSNLANAKFNPAKSNPAECNRGKFSLDKHVPSPARVAVSDS